MNLIEQIFKKGGTVIPDEVWDCEELTPTDVKLYKILLDYGKLVYTLAHGKFTKDNYPIITVSQETLSIKVRTSIKTIQTCLKRLTDVKLIKVDRYNGYKRNNNIVLTGEFYGIQPKKKEKEEPQEPKKELSVVEKKVKRVSVKRVPIKFPKTLALEAKLRELGGHTYSEKAIFAISRHYDMLAREFNHLAGYRSLPKKEQQEHKNWKQFVKIHDLCKSRAWDVNLYLDAQFERAKKYWKNNKIKYPLPNMLCSEKSKLYFERYLEDRREKYAQDVGNKQTEKGRKTVTIKQKLIQDVVRSAEYLSMYIREDMDEQGREEDKAVRIYHAWESYSPAYLWSIDWFREFIADLSTVQPDNPKVQEILAEFDLINRSKSLQEVVVKAVSMSEKQFKIPKNIAI